MNKEKKVLFVATVDSHILQFHIPYLKWFKEMVMRCMLRQMEKKKFLIVIKNIKFALREVQ